MTTRALFDAALAATRNWHSTLPAARAFCPWPQDIAYRARAPYSLPATELIQTAPGAVTEASTQLVNALQALAPHLEWRLTYTAEEVGQHFLDNFGWFELAGPDGHFITHETRITVGYWGPGLHYDRHQHQAEELYTVLSGEAIFMADGEEDHVIGPQGTRLHASNQPHALATTHSPVLTLVFWRGEGLSDAPAMSAA